MRDNLATLDESFRYQDRMKAAGVNVVGSGFTRGGEFEIVVVDPHQRRGPRVSIIGKEEAERFLERIRG